MRRAFYCSQKGDINIDQRRSALGQACKIRPSDLPMQQVTKTEPLINLKALGFEIPRTLLRAAPILKHTTSVTSVARHFASEADPCRGGWQLVR